MLNILKDYGKDVSWDVGALFAHDAYIHSLVDVCKDIGIAVPIKYVFGSIPCVFQGGRVAPRDATLPNALKIMEDYFNRGIKCRLTFSSTLVTEDRLSDKLSNQLLDFLNKTEGNGVLVCSDLLAKYIHDKYPNLEVIASMVKPSVEVGLGNDTLEYYNNLFELYDRITVNPFMINDGGFLRSITYKDRVDFIANHHCVPNCSNAGKCYQLYDAVGDKALREESYEDDLAVLREIDEKCCKLRKKYPLAGVSFTDSDIQMLLEMGFSNFRLEGRDNSGACFIRDLGDYLFIPGMYSRIAHAVMGEEV